MTCSACSRKLVASGKHLAIMAHLNHWRELSTPVVRTAIRRLRDAGAVIRAQAPVLAHINDDAQVWQRLWQDEVHLGVVPYYMFVERDTGARRYFEVPLERTRQIYADAISNVSGLARTVRGPSMSAGPGKVEVVGVQEIAGEKIFVLRFLQGRNPDWVGRPFFSKFDPQSNVARPVEARLRRRPVLLRGRIRRDAALSARLKGGHTRSYAFSGGRQANDRCMMRGWRPPFGGPAWTSSGCRK